MQETTVSKESTAGTRMGWDGKERIREERAGTGRNKGTRQERKKTGTGTSSHLLNTINQFLTVWD